MTLTLAFSIALFLLSIISGMLGIGVAIVAVPVLSLGLPDLVNQVHPLSLILNGVTAMLSAVAFARNGLIDWRRAALLAAVSTLATPIGSIAARVSPDWCIWATYFLAVTFLCYRMLKPGAVSAETGVRLGPILLLAFPASVLSGYVGVGAGFLLVPLMVHFGIDIRRAAGINAVAVTPSSFAAALPHLSHMTLAPSFVGILCAAAAAGSFVGAQAASKSVPPHVLRRVFLAAIIGATCLRALKLLA